MAHAHDSTLPIRQLGIVVQRLLVTGYPKLELVAGEVGITRRTLQRRLATVGTSYSNLVNETRYQLAAELLEDHRVPISSIARAVGFANHSGFSRASAFWAYAVSGSVLDAAVGWARTEGAVAVEVRS